MAIDHVADRLSWLDGEDVRPYIFVRADSRIINPGSRYDWDWFQLSPLYKNPLLMDEVGFADQILRLEGKSFQKSAMEMPRWVFFDCAVMPGFVAGFAQKTSTMSDKMKQALEVDETQEWTPISLFIVIPTMGREEWVAHNLCSMNALVDKDHKYYGLGFLTKAYALWHANIQTCCGMTQWKSPARKLHSNYGDFEVLTAYTPVHSYAKTLTYRCRVNPDYWVNFFSGKKIEGFTSRYRPAGFQIDPMNEEDLISFQRKIEAAEGPFFLDPQQIRTQDLKTPLDVYQLKD